ncbi:MAG: hypothetical protein A2583_03785 [Bdellovibrionales bacterium RIFOXYD1_FULL_53_11]|nr:MAG: hypothetical protein A2583_03785 [Bdellovibrionales bacterium RIFOXYD1_FULL_53_11]
MDESALGGAGTHLVTMIRETKRSHPQIRHKVIILFGEGPVAKLVRTLDVPLDLLDIRELVQKKSILKIFFLLYRKIRDSGADVVEAHLTWSRLLALPAAFFVGVKTRIGYEQGDIYFNSLKWRIANFVAQWFASAIIVCSHELKKWVISTHGVLPGKLLVYHNCVDSRSFGATVDIRTEKMRFFDSAERVVVCAVGTLGHGVNKRMDVCIRAVAEAKKTGIDAGLVVCGYGPQQKDLERLCRDEGVEDRVRFLGMRLDVDMVMASCDLFCHAAPFEPFGIVCAEAMLLGLPAVVPSTGGMREMIDDGVDGFLYPSLDHAALAGKMEILCLDPGLRKRMGSKAREKILRDFEVRPYMRRLLARYGVFHDGGK